MCVERLGQVVLHEDKQYYPSAEEVYGRGVEVLVEEEDRQPLSEPVIAAPRELRFEYTSRPPARRQYSDEHLLWLLEGPRRRSLLLAGGLHAGKTSLVDVLVAETAPGELDSLLKQCGDNAPRWLDNRVLERQRGITLCGKAMTVAAPDSKGASWALQVFDPPGHGDFCDEAAMAMAGLDPCVLLVLDVTEGLTLTGEEQLRLAVAMNRPILLLLNKVERLILELRLPPNDAYFRLRHCIEEVNTFIRSCNGTQQLSPELGTVIFGSTLYGWLFSLSSWAQAHVRRSGAASLLDPQDLAQRLWGDIYWDPSRRRFTRTPGSGPVASKRSFVSWILEPICKLHVQAVGEEGEGLDAVLAQVNVTLNRAEQQMDTRPRLALLMQRFLGPALPCLVDALRDHADDRSCGMADRPTTTIECIKAYPDRTAASMELLVRVHSGRLVTGQALHPLDPPGLAPEERPAAVVQSLRVPCGRYSIPVASAPAGTWVLVAGLDGLFAKPGSWSTDPAAHSPSAHPVLESPIRVALEPAQPSDLPRLLEGLRHLTKAMPALRTRVEESGEHALLGPGELYLDTAFHDLRTIYAPGVSLRLADPTVLLAETVVDTSFLKCFADTPNQRSRLTLIAEPLEKGLAEAIESGRFASTSPREREAILRSEFGWDLLAARSLMAFGPDPVRGPNVLLDDTLPDETDKESLQEIREALIQGFQWAVREGPLTESPVRGLRFRLIDALLAAEPVYRAPGQIIPTMRRACYSALLTAGPRLMEPVARLEIRCPKECVQVAYEILAKRRGHVLKETPVAGSPLTALRAQVPLLDAFGMETDLRTSTLGGALPQSSVSLAPTWQVVPGDPLDSDIQLVPLEPAPAPHLARDLLLKTRRRKGLTADLTIARFFDEPMMAELAREQAAAGLGSLKI